MKELQHPNVVEYMDDFFIGPKLFIVMRFMPRNVLELLESSPGNRLPRAVGECVRCKQCLLRASQSGCRCFCGWSRGFITHVYIVI